MVGNYASGSGGCGVSRMGPELNGEAEQVDLAGRSDDERDYAETGFMGRTFFDFEDEKAVPMLTVKSFLKDCLQHPKILFHKDVEFFRAYLTEVNNKLMTLPANSSFQENHEDAKFCVDMGDKKWLDKLKNRVDSNENFNWASIARVVRKAETGLIIFEWTPGAFSAFFLEAYIEHCRTLTENYLDMTANDEEDGKRHDISKVHGYIADFLELFRVDKNMDVEIRNQEAEEAENMRKASNKVEPPTTDLLYLFEKQPKSAKSSARAKGQKDTANSSSSESATDLESNSSLSGLSEGKEGQKKLKHPTGVRQAIQVPINEPSKNSNGMKMRQRTQTVMVTDEVKKAYDNGRLNAYVAIKKLKDNPRNVLTLCPRKVKVVLVREKIITGSGLKSSGGKVLLLKNEKNSLSSDTVKPRNETGGGSNITEKPAQKKKETKVESKAARGKVLLLRNGFSPDVEKGRKPFKEGQVKIKDFLKKVDEPNNE